MMLAAEDDVDEEVASVEDEVGLDELELDVEEDDNVELLEVVEEEEVEEEVEPVIGTLGVTVGVSAGLAGVGVVGSVGVAAAFAVVEADVLDDVGAAARGTMCLPLWRCMIARWVRVIVT